MKCHKCNKSLQDETAVSFEGLVYCYKCYMIKIQGKAFNQPIKDKMIRNTHAKLETKEKHHHYTG